MPRYDNLTTRLQNTIYTNSSGDIKGNTLQTMLVAFINTLGKGSNFMGMLTDSNKPTTIPDGKQFYIGYNNSNTALSVNLTAVGLGTLSITKGNIYIVYCDDNGWAAVDIASGLKSTIPTNVNQLTGYDGLQPIEQYVPLDGDVFIEKIESNKDYYLTNCIGLRVVDYHYDISEPADSLSLPESHIFVTPLEDFVIILPSGSLVHEGDTLTLSQNKSYVITVKANYWKIEYFIHQL